jgi:ubiquitin-conjugating enzyme E2 D/E
LKDNRAWLNVILLKFLSSHLVFNALVNLLAEPNPDDPLSATIAEQYRAQPEEFKATARDWVTKYAQS